MILGFIISISIRSILIFNIIYIQFYSMILNIAYVYGREEYNCRTRSKLRELLINDKKNW